MNLNNCHKEPRSINMMLIWSLIRASLRKPAYHWTTCSLFKPAVVSTPKFLTHPRFKSPGIMSSFQAHLLPDNVPHNLTAVIFGSHPAREFRRSKVIHHHNSVVQRGLLHVDENATLPAVCKFVHGDDVARLKYEAELYEDPRHLKNLQGVYVPRFYGYFEGPTQVQELEVSFGCMVLEDCGRMVDEWTVYRIK